MKRTGITPLLIVALLAVVAAAPCSADDETKPQMSPEAQLLPDKPGPESFGKQPEFNAPYDPEAQLAIYDKKHMNPTAFPPVDLGLALYGRGAYTPRPTFFGTHNPIMSAFMAYGDLRVGAASYDNGKPGPNGKTRQSVLAARLNLDMDWQLTATERFHAFVRPLDKGTQFTRVQLGSGISDRFVDEANFSLKTLFFEGDLGQMRQGLTGTTSYIDLPVAIGRVPFVTQNGVWFNAAFDGAAIDVLSAKNNARHDVSNYDLTLFAALRNVPTGGAGNSVTPDTNNRMYGASGFADLHRGYLEWGYGYLDADNHDLSYHNVSAAFTKRYRGKVSNSVRVIGNFGQKGIAGQKTADGALLLLENSLITSQPSVLVPYANLFAGFNSPQPLARAGDIGGVLANTGINFESDGLTGYPTLDPFAHNSYGGAAGVEYLFDLHRQIVVEGAVVERWRGNTAGRQYALGARYQHPLNNMWILRLDAMHGWLQDAKDVFGARIELRMKF